MSTPRRAAAAGRRTVLCVVGTRPECIKMAPVIAALRATDWCDAVVVSTGQHRELVAQTLGIFGIAPDVDLDLMEPGQTLASLTGRIQHRFDPVLTDLAPALVLAQGDTTTVMACAMGAFYRRIPFGHVEAGLRTHDLGNPFPEEFNRRVAGMLAALHFAPTAGARDNLLAEGTAPATVHVTGNTVIDALLEVASRPDLPCAYPLDASRRLVLMTSHRRENFGEPLRNICRAMQALVARFPDIEVVYPVHPNPNVRDTVMPMLGGLARVHLIEPVDYLALAGLLKRCHFALTDSGGIQEEAPALGKPVLVMRAETERPEAVAAGVARLVGTDTDRIIGEASRVLEDRDYHQALSRGASPYGDGRAAGRIAELCRAFLADGR
ncbi:MAG: non-hydrolyzing UDP-N-acetylglucosamine 2-epimerase [Acetobacteraceae bacterium]